MHGISEQRLNATIASIYEAARTATAGAWMDVYRKLAKVFSSSVGGFTVYDTRTGTFHELFTTLPPPYQRAFHERYQFISPIHQRIAQLRPGERFNRKEEISDKEFINTEIYRNFYSRVGIYHFEYQVFLARPGMHGGIAFSRPEGAPNFNARELGLMKLLLPHIERAFQIYVDLDDMRLENKVVTEALDRIRRKVLVVDSSLSLVYANRGARDILDEKDGLTLASDGRLQAWSRGDQRVLKDLLTRTVDGAGGALSVERPSGRRPLEVLLRPFSQKCYRSISSEPLALAFISDPEPKAAALNETLGKLYGLTAAESRLAAMLAEGRTVAEVCEKLEISPNTAHSHLKRIFSKTATNRQGELVRLILEGPASIQGPR